MSGERNAHRLLSASAAPKAVAAAVAVAAIAAALLAALSAPPWATAAGIVVVAAACLITVNGSTAGQWVAAAWRYRRRQRRTPELVPPVQLVEVPAGRCAVRWSGDQVIAAIQLGPDVFLPTFVGGGAYDTEDIVPIAAIAELDDQYGLHFDIDICSSGARVPAGRAHSTLYAGLAGTQPIIGMRHTWLILRLDVADNLAEIARRGPAASAAPAAMATAAHRLAQHLRERGHRADPLLGPALDEAWDILTANESLNSWDETWHALRSPGGREVASYWVADGNVTTAAVQRIWSWHTEATTTTFRLHRDRHSGDMSVVGLVRYLTAGHDDAPLDFLQRAGGQQRPALQVSLPDRAPRVGGEALTALTAETALDIPLGPTGQIVGTVRSGATCVLPLFDASLVDPTPMRVEVQASTFVLKQLVLRAIAVGAEVVVHTDRPHRWRPMANEINDPGLMRILPAGVNGGPATIAVLDMVDAPTTARTVIAARAAGAPLQGADITVVQPDLTQPEIRVRISRGTIDATLIRSRSEDRYIGDLLDDIEPARPVPPPAPAPRPPHDPDRQRPVPPRPAPDTAPANRSSGRPQDRRAQAPTPPPSELVSTSTTAVRPHSSAVPQTARTPQPVAVVEPPAPVGQSDTPPRTAPPTREESREIMARARADARRRATTEHDSGPPSGRHSALD